jgi:hypothetical protein
MVMNSNSFISGGCNGSQVLDNTFNAATDNGGADVNFSCTGSDSSNVTVSGNSTTGNTGGSSFIAFSGVIDGILVTHNTGSTSGSAVFFWGSVSGSAAISGNEITNSAGSAVSIHGGDLGIDTPNTGTFEISCNTLSNNVRGVYVASAFGTGSIATYLNNITGNSIAGVENASAITVNAINNWWGSASGPSGAGSGSGDVVSTNVTYQPWLTSPAYRCNQQLLKNWDFEGVSGKKPSSWNTSKFNAKTDGLDCTTFNSGACSLKLVGNGNQKIMSQTINIKKGLGLAGDAYFFDLSSKADSIPAGSTYTVQVLFYNKTHLVGSDTQTFTTGTHDFQTLSDGFTAPSTYTKIIFKITFKATSGTVWFDTAGLFHTN